jgi:hypothetical protein
MNIIKQYALISGFIFVFGFGCSNVKDSLIGGATSGLSRGVGRAASERVEQGAYQRLAPKSQLPKPKTPGWNQYMALHAQIIFTYSFSAGGFWLGTTDYQPGDYTKFEFKSKDESSVLIEKAYLKLTDDGKKWWRVSWSDGKDTWVYEALIASDGQLLRLRAKDANGTEGEIPVEQGQTVIYTPPTTLTKESIQGATVGKESITTPAGTFETDHVKYMSMGSEGEVEFWITDKVPGGAAKYQINDKKEGAVWTCTLKEMGKNATTILKSF